MKAVKFGVIGCGLMGREFASAVSRWCHLLNMEVKPGLLGTPNVVDKFNMSYPEGMIYELG